MEISLEGLRGLTLAELRKFVAHAEEQARSLHQTPAGELRDLTAEEQTEFDRLMGLRSRAILKAETLDELRAGFGATPSNAAIAYGTPALHVGLDTADPVDVVRMRPAEARDSALRALEARGKNLGPDQQDQVDKLLRATISDDNPNLDGGYIAKRTLITESDAYRSAWRQAVTQQHPMLTQEEVYALRALNQLDVEYRAMSEGTTTAGGFGVPVFIDPTIVMTAQGSLNPIRRIARTEIITTNRWKGVSSAGVSWSFQAEAATVADNSPTIAQPTVDTQMARGFVPFSIELGMDYPNFANEMAQLLAEGYDELLAQKYAIGAGAGSFEPRGVITALTANTNVQVAVTTDGTFSGSDINKIWTALPDRFKSNATWMMSHDVGGEVAKLGNGNNLSFVTVDLTNVVTSLRQRPVEFSSYFPNFVLSTTSTPNLMVVGDFRNYLIASRAGMNIEYVPQLFQQTTAGTGFGRPTGQRGWFAWARTGGDSIVDNAFRMLQS